MIRRFITAAAALMALAATSYAYDPAINDIVVSVLLQKDGTALVSERWDLVAGEGTEWYLVRDNLDDIVVSGLQVSDETGRRFIDEGNWDVDRSIQDKAGRCGIVRKRDGVEICWGLGSYGPHVFNVSYRMSNAVRLLEDYDIFHMQLVSPGLSSRPQHVKVTVEAEDTPMDSSFVRLWGFGYEGSAKLIDGKAVFESTEQFRRGSSVISIIRFEKGIFEGGSREHRYFQEVIDEAMEGAEFDDDDVDSFPIIIIILMFFLPVILGVGASKLSKREILGCNPKDVDWSRDIPFDGDLVETEYVMKKLGAIKKENTMAAAMILRMIYNGQLVVSKDAKGKVEIAFSDDSSKLGALDSPTRKLYDMMLEASGSDRILQDKEFSKWSSKSSSQKRINEWAASLDTEATNRLMADGYIKGRKFLPVGQEKSRQAYGFRKFLEDFTMIAGRETVEVHLWQEYLVYGALYGIAEKVAEQLKDIKTITAEDVVVNDWATTYTILRMTNRMSQSITNAHWSANSSGARGGFGGSASFGGGGGFHGGGFGGGAR